MINKILNFLFFGLNKGNGEKPKTKSPEVKRNFTSSCGGVVDDQFRERIFDIATSAPAFTPIYEVRSDISRDDKHPETSKSNTRKVPSLPHNAMLVSYHDPETFETVQHLVSEELKADISWDDWALQLAQHWAKRSKDPSTKVGAVIIGKDRRNVAGGYNGLPSGIPDLPEYLNNRDQKYPLIIHAERNALDNAQFNVEGGTIYVTRYPCSECAKGLVNKRIKRVVYEINDAYEARVAEDIKVSARTFALAGVVVEGRSV